MLNNHFHSKCIISIHEESVCFVLAEASNVCRFYSIQVRSEVGIFRDACIVYHVKVDSFKLTEMNVRANNL